MELYKTHFKTHPDEYEGIRILKEKSKAITDARKEAQKKKLEKVEYYRRLLDEQSTR